jgi:hypothetical protein
MSPENLRHAQSASWSSCQRDQGKPAVAGLALERSLGNEESQRQPPKQAVDTSGAMLKTTHALSGFAKKCALMEDIFSSTDLSWRSILAGFWSRMSGFTTKMESETTIELKTLNYGT